MQLIVLLTGMIQAPKGFTATNDVGARGGTEAKGTLESL